MCRVEPIELLVGHPTEPGVWMQWLGVILKVADTLFEKPDLFVVIEAGRRDEHARSTNATDRVPGEKPREREGSQDRA